MTEKHARFAAIVGSLAVSLAITAMWLYLVLTLIDGGRPFP